MNVFEVQLFRSADSLFFSFLSLLLTSGKFLLVIDIYIYIGKIRNEISFSNREWKGNGRIVSVDQ